MGGPLIFGVSDQFPSTRGKVLSQTSIAEVRVS